MYFLSPFWPSVAEFVMLRTGSGILPTWITLKVREARTVKESYLIVLPRRAVESCDKFIFQLSSSVLSTLAN